HLPRDPRHWEPAYLVGRRSRAGGAGRAMGPQRRGARVTRTASAGRGNRRLPTLAGALRIAITGLHLVSPADDPVPLRGTGPGCRPRLGLDQGARGHWRRSAGRGGFVLVLLPGPDGRAAHAGTVALAHSVLGLRPTRGTA